MYLLDKGWVPKIVLIFLRSHGVRGQNMFLEHELLWILLAFTENTLIAAANSPVILADPDGVGA